MKHERRSCEAFLHIMGRDVEEKVNTKFAKHFQACISKKEHRG
jgi:hypothetical protein